MHRRSFLTGAAALAVVPMLPAAPASISSAAIASEPVTVARYANCEIWSASGMRVFDVEGVLRITVGFLDADWDSEKPTLVIQHG